MTSVSSFDEIKDDFLSTVAKIVWCNVATVDTQGRPRSLRVGLAQHQD